MWRRAGTYNAEISFCDMRSAKEGIVDDNATKGTYGLSGEENLGRMHTSSLCYIPCRSSDHHNLSLLFSRHITAKYELFKNEKAEPRNLGNKNVNRIEWRGMISQPIRHLRCENTTRTDNNHPCNDAFGFYRTQYGKHVICSPQILRYS